MFYEKAELLQKAEFRKLQPTVKVEMEQVQLFQYRAFNKARVKLKPLQFDLRA